MTSIQKPIPQLTTKEDSYSERRQLFKNIWETAMQIDEKDGDIMNKPKVIKTLRLDEVDTCVIGKRKKERLKNLRTVCNKILDFCDRQDANDKFYEQMEVKDQIQNKIEIKPKKKIHRGRRKVKKSKSAFGPSETIVNQAKATTSERKNFNDRTQSSSPTKVKRTVLRPHCRHRRASMVKSSLDNAEENKSPGKISVTRRKIVTKRRSKRKKVFVSPPDVSPPRPSGVLNNVRYDTTPLKGRRYGCKARKRTSCGEKNRNYLR